MITSTEGKDMTRNKDRSVTLTEKEFDTLIELAGEWEEDCESQYPSTAKDKLVTDLTILSIDGFFA